MSRIAPEVFGDPLPAAFPARTPGGAGTTSFVTLTDDAALREAIEGAVTKRGRAVMTTTTEGFADELVAHPGGIAILDITLITGGVPQFIERLRAQFPGLVLVAAGGARDQAALAPLVADGTVCRFAHKPVSAQRLGLFLDAALRRRDALANEQREILLAPVRPTTSSAARIAVLILLLAAAAGTALWLLRRPAVPESSAADTSPATPTVAAAAVTAPAAITASAPAATAAAAPAPPSASAPALAPAPADDPVPQARHEAELARRLMDVGLLIEPPNNSARSHIQIATRLAPDDPEVRRAARALSGRLVNAARNALLAEDVASAERWLNAARAYGVNPATLAELAEQVDMLKGMHGQ